MDWKDALGSLLPDNYTPETDSAPDSAAQAPRQTTRLDVLVERKGRGGKVATIVAGFTVADSEVEQIASKLKQRLGTGGSARGGEILIQGDRPDAVLKALTDMGYKARKI